MPISLIFIYILRNFSLLLKEGDDFHSETMVSKYKVSIGYKLPSFIIRLFWPKMPNFVLFKKKGLFLEFSAKNQNWHFLVFIEPRLSEQKSVKFDAKIFRKLVTNERTDELTDLNSITWDQKMQNTLSREMVIFKNCMNYFLQSQRMASRSAH